MIFKVIVRKQLALWNQAYLLDVRWALHLFPEITLSPWNWYRSGSSWMFWTLKPHWVGGKGKSQAISVGFDINGIFTGHYNEQVEIQELDEISVKTKNCKAGKNMITLTSKSTEGVPPLHSFLDCVLRFQVLFGTSPKGSLPFRQYAFHILDLTRMFPLTVYFPSYATYVIVIMGKMTTFCGK